VFGCSGDYLDDEPGGLEDGDCFRQGVGFGFGCDFMGGDAWKSVDDVCLSHEAELVGVWVDINEVCGALC